MYSAHLDCFISCATNYKNSLVLGWIEKSKMNMRTWVFWQHLHGVPLSFEKCADKILHMSIRLRKPRSVDSAARTLPFYQCSMGSILALRSYVGWTYWFSTLGPVSQNSRNFSGSTILFISSHRQGSKLSTLAILLVFLTSVSMLKHQLFKTSRLKFDNWLSWARKVVGTFARTLGPVSRKSRNFSGLFQVPPLPLYLRNAEVLSLQTSQSSWFFLY